MKLAIDLGGTNLRIAKIEDNLIVATKSVECPAQGSESVILDLIKAMIREFISPDVDGIGIGVPSIVDAEKGIVYDVANIPSWKEVHLKEILEKEFNVKTCIDNDVNCFVLGEKHFGSGKGYENMVGITLGTGVGAGIIIDNSLYRGTNTGAGEIGSLPYLDSDYEHYCSSSFLSKSGSDGKRIFELAEQGDASALNTWCQFGHHLGKLLQVVLFVYDPQAIIIGGGISAASPFFESAMRESMKKDFPYSRTANNIKLFFSTLVGSNLLGASKL
ncbi:MAG: ROK family protein [Bacteroidales bacterium]|nr:ROK family protein [Bacteroidales bacterium]